MLQAHLLRCSANQGRLDAWSAFRKATPTKKDPHPFWHCLVEGIKTWTRNADNTYLPDVTGYPPHLRRALAAAALSQKEIGWDNTLRGFLSTEWIHLASLDMHDQTLCSEDRGNARIRKALSSIYEYTWKTWDSRNEVLHTKDKTTLAANIRSADCAAIKHYHSKPHLLRFDDRHLCDRPLIKLLHGSSSTQTSGNPYLCIVNIDLGFVLNISYGNLPHIMYSQFTNFNVFIHKMYLYYVQILSTHM